MPELHEAFQNAGKKAGIEVWRIESFEPVPVPKEQYGKFYSGDSYIVLKTTGTPSSFSWDIHFWLGSGTSSDEAGTAAILTVNLDDLQFQGAAVQHRETQGHESKKFLSYFEPAIRYLDGGHASGFSHVAINEGTEKRLFQIKGKRNARVRQVEPNISSMNKGDCFLLDINHEILLYYGPNAKHVEQAKAITVAQQIKDQDHHGRAEIIIFDNYSAEDPEKFFTALGSGDSESVPEADEGGDDAEFERETTQEASLSEISDHTGSMKITKLKKPFTRDQLNSQECYILDTGVGVYVWVGRKSNQKEKTEAMNKAHHYLKEHNLPPWVHVSKVPEEMEPPEFKQYFEGWL